MSLCVIPRALDGLPSSKVTLINPISLNRAEEKEQAGRDQTGLRFPKKVDLLLFLTGLNGDYFYAFVYRGRQNCAVISV